MEFEKDKRQTEPEGGEIYNMPDSLKEEIAKGLENGENVINSQRSLIGSITDKYKKKKIRRRIKKLAVLLLTAVFVIALVMSINIYNDAVKLNIKENTSFELSGGETAEEVAKILKDKGIIKYEKAFLAIARLKTLETGYYKGRFTAVPGMKYTGVLRMLLMPPPETMVTFSEGLTKEEIYKKLSETGYVSVSDLEAAERSVLYYDFLEDIKRDNPLEGYLFCDTYEFAVYQTPKQMLEVFLNQFDKIFTDEYKRRSEKIGMSTDEIVILASVIESETAGAENMKKVSDVFHKRLERGEKLQSCATVQYLLNEKKFVLSSKDLKIDSPYNTYMYEGLPKGPICSPSSQAIEAALYPADTDYYYFQSDIEGNMYFSKTFEEHEKIRKKVQGEN